MGALSEYKDFLSKRNVVDLAVAVVIGSAIGALVTAMVTNLITPLIGVPGHFNFSSINYTVNGSTFHPGLFINALINFIVITLVVFFFIVRPITKMQERASAGKDSTTKVCPECLSTIPLKATRCAYCTAKLKADTS